MLKTEKRVLEYTEKHIYVIFAVAVLMLGCCMRIVGFHFLSDDARLYLLKWYDIIAEKGISEQVGNYNIPYQIIIFILTKLPLKPLHAYKLVSCGFDLLMSILGGYIVWEISEKNKAFRSVMAFTLVFCSPLVILNSAVWAQCDSIYAFFGIAALVLLFHERFVFSFIMLGLAFSFKLQAVFLVPFFLIYYVCRKKYSILHFLLIPVMMVITSLPGLLVGRSIKEILDIYIEQTDTYNRVFVNFPNVYTLVTNAKGSGDYEMFRRYAILLTILMLGLGLYRCVCKGLDFTNKKIFWGIVIWSLYTCSFFLPNMHERYAYIMEVTAILYCFITPVGVPVAVVSNLLALIVYSEYLFGRRALKLTTSSFISLIMYILFSLWIFGRVLRNQTGLSPEKK